MSADSRRSLLASLRSAVPAALSCSLILSGCAGGADAPVPTRVGTATPAPMSTPTDPSPVDSASSDIKALTAVTVASLMPDEALDPRQVGKRIRWAGAIHQIAPTERGVCLTILYAPSGDAGQPRWSREATPGTFRACTDGSYDRTLVGETTNVTIIGRISGKANIGMGGGSSPGPVVEIEKLFRWSDCLSGDTSPDCRIGFVMTSDAPDE